MESPFDSFSRPARRLRDGVVHEAPVWRSGQAPEAGPPQREGLNTTPANRSPAPRGASNMLCSAHADSAEAGRHGRSAAWSGRCDAGIRVALPRSSGLPERRRWLPYAQSFAHEAFFKYAILGYDHDAALTRRDPMTSSPNPHPSAELRG